MYAYISHLEVAAEFAFGVKYLDIDGGLLQKFPDYDRDAKR